MGLRSIGIKPVRDDGVKFFGIAGMLSGLRDAALSLIASQFATR